MKVVDTTGAGDAYAAGFLYAYTQGLDLATCGRLGGAMAAQVISQYGPRADVKDVKALGAKISADRFCGGWGAGELRRLLPSSLAP